ncbi:alkaline phosphatase [Marispirochaeta aestuarii]|uniref:alkaline phosphatase n=1 Tax=Marispirochaeta aestuarii TaxID=1963862 RepID=UPI0029C8418A|nr:alkaline phosphatase [Marispirochaeta aestuarii]
MKMSSLKKYAALLLVLLVPSLIWAEGARETETEEIQASQARYVFLFIGDGMALTQINAAEAYLKSQTETDVGVEKLAFSQFPNQGLTTTYDAGSFITDSASAGTAIATGHKTLSGVINMDTSKSIKYTTIAEMAKAAGMKVGVISSVNLDHATPACFYAKEASRNNYYNIGVQLANSNFDYFAGGMLRLDKTPQGQKNVHEIMAEKGWLIASNRNELRALRPGTRQVYAYSKGFAGNALDYAMDMKTDTISLAEYTSRGIELLDNENGFFMMVEGGKIDWACHANDAAASINDTIAFDNAVKEAVDFYNRHPEETLIIVTGDHETGGLSLGFAGTKYDSAFTEIGRQKMSFEAFDHYVLKPFKQNNPTGSLAQLMPEIRKNFGIDSLSPYESELLENAFNASMKGVGEDEESYLLYGGYEPISVTLTHILNNRAGLAWASYSHTGVPVATFALGVGGELFNGYYDNTEIFRKAATVLGLGVPVLASR